MEQSNDLAGAKAAFTEAMTDSSDINTRINASESLGRLYMNVKNYDEARNVFQKMATAFPDRNEAKLISALGLAGIARDEEAYDQAVKILKEAEAKCLNNMYCCRIEEALAQNYRLMNQSELLKEVYKKVLEKYPDCWLAQEARQASGAQ